MATEAGGRLWMQLYVMSDRELTRNIISRVPIKLGTKHWSSLLMPMCSDTVSGISAITEQPAKLNLRNMVDVASAIPRWLFDVLIPHGVPRFENIIDFMPPEGRTAQGGVAFVPTLFDAKISWEDVEWLREVVAQEVSS